MLLQLTKIITFFKNMILLSIICLISCTYTTESSRILGVFYPPSYSHFTLSSTLMKELAAKGHEVTMISPYPQKTPLKNYRDIKLDGFDKEFEETKANFFELDGTNFVLTEIFVHNLIIDAIEKALSKDNVQQLLHSNETFDLVIVEDFVSHALKGFCYHFKAPCIMFSSFGLSRISEDQVANPCPPSYVPDFTLTYGSNMNFFERLHNSAAYLFSKIYTQLYVFPRHNQIIQKYFPGAPDVRQLFHNVSLVFLNSHVSTSIPVPLVPNMIEIGGFHIKPSKPLPVDLENYLNSAKEGVIFFSMGSNLRSTDMPSEKREIFLKAFSRLKQKVLWKWEDEHLPGQPSNVKIGKWLPQPDILAHPNVKLFITHGGLLSTMEAVHHGIPIVGIPIYGDQKMNLANAVNSGFGLEIPYKELTEEKLFAIIQEATTNPKYKENAQRRSKIMQDQPLKPIEKATFWVDYVIRHQGAVHLRSAALNLSWYQYLLLDVVLFICIVIVTITASLYFIIKKIVCKKSFQKIKDSKKKKN